MFQRNSLTRELFGLGGSNAPTLIDIKPGRMTFDRASSLLEPAAARKEGVDLVVVLGSDDFAGCSVFVPPLDSIP